VRVGRRLADIIRGRNFWMQRFVWALMYNMIAQDPLLLGERVFAEI